MIFVRDRVKQGTTTNGAGTISLTSSFGGFQNFSVLGNNSQTFYAIEESTNWEVGIGTYSGTTLTRDTVLDSASGAGIPIYLSGSAVVFVTYPASGSVFSTGSIALATGINVGASGITVTAGGDINLDEDQRIYFESDKGTWIETDSEDRLRFVVGGNQMLLLDEDDDRVNIGFGNKLAVGLGNNTSPAYDLDVSGVGNFSSGIRVSGITFLEDGGKEQRIAYTPASGAKIDANTTGIYSTSGNLVSTGNALFTGLYNVSGSMVSSSTIISTGNAVQTGVFTTSGNLNTRISTIESSGAVTGLGSAPSTNVKKLALWDATDGLTFDTNLTFNTNIDELVLGVSGIRFADASNQNTAFENWSLIVSNPDKEYYNYVTAGSNTVGSGAGVDFSGVNGIYTTGQLISSKRHKVTISGVAGSTSQVGVLQLQDSVDTSTTKAVTPNAVRVVSGDLQSQIGSSSFTHATGAKIDSNTTGIYSTSGNLVSTGNVLHSRISTIESTGVATAANLASTGDTVIANLVSTGNAVFTGLYNVSGNLNTRLSTIESTGVATAANLASTGDTVIANLVSTGNAVFTGLYNVSGNMVDSSTLISTGNVLFTGLYNVSGNLNDSIDQLSTGSVSCRLLTASGTSVSHMTSTKCKFTEVDYQYGNISGDVGVHPNSTGRIHLLESGVYHINAGTAWNFGTLLGNWGIGIRKNNIEYVDERTYAWDGHYTETSFGGDRDMHIDHVVTGVSGDYFDIYLWNENASSSSRSNTANRTWYSITKLQGSKGDKGDKGDTGPAGGDYSFTVSGTGTPYSDIYNSNVIQITGAGDTSVTFTSGSPNIFSVSTTLSATTGAQIDSNSSRLSTIESTGVATAANLVSTGNAVQTGVFTTSGNLNTRISTIESTGVATAANLVSTGNAVFTGLYNVSGSMVSSSTIVSTGNAVQTGVFTTSGNLNTRISTIESTGVATAANLVSTGNAVQTGVFTTSGNLNTRISTIESTGVATAANLISTGNAVFTGLYNVSGSMVSSSTIVSTGNAVQTGVFTTSGNLNTRISTIESTGVATAANLVSTGNAVQTGVFTTSGNLNTRISTIESTGVATAANLISTGNAVFTGLYNVSGNMVSSSTIVSTGNAVQTGVFTTSGNLNTRISTIESTGVATAANLISTGNAVFTGLYNVSGNMVSSSTIVSTGNAVQTGVFTTSGNLNTRLSTIESTGVATAANLISTGNAVFTGLYNVSGNMVSSSTIVSTGNAVQTGVFTTSGNLNTRISTIESTGVATAANLISTGNAVFTGLYNVSGSMVSSSTIVSTGNAVQTGVFTTSGNLNTRISTIESTGVATAANLASTGDTAITNLIATGVRSQVGHYDIDVKTTKTSGILTPIISGAGGTKKTFDLSLGNTFTHTLTANTTFYLANVTQGQKFIIRTQQDGTASRSVTWGFDSAGNGTVRWAEGGTAPTGTALPAGVADVYGFIAIGTGTYDGFVIGNNLQ